MSMYNTLQTMNIKGSFGYDYKAMQPEAFSLVASNRGHGVDQWFPWLAAAAMDPLHRFMDAFGEYDIKELEKWPKEKLIELNSDYAKTLGIYRGFSSSTQ